MVAAGEPVVVTAKLKGVPEGPHSGVAGEDRQLVHRDRPLDLGGGEVIATALLVGVNQAVARPDVVQCRRAVPGDAALQTPDPLSVSTEKTTGLPEAPPVADSVAEVPVRPKLGPVKLTACGWSTVRLKLWAALGLTPLLAVIVSG